MAVTVEGTPTEHTDTDGGTSATFSHTVPAGATNCLIVVVGTGDAVTADRNVTSVTWNSTSLTQIPSFEADDANFLNVSAWYLLSPTAATGDVVITTNGATSQIAAGAINLSDVHQTTPFGTAASATGSGTTASVQISSGSGQMAFFSIFTDDANLISPTGTEIFEIEGIAGDTSVAAQHYAGAETVTGQWNQSADAWAIAGVSIRPTSFSASAPTGPVDFMFRRGKRANRKRRLG